MRVNFAVKTVSVKVSVAKRKIVEMDASAMVRKMVAAVVEDVETAIVKKKKRPRQNSYEATCRRRRYSYLQRS